MGFLLLMCFAHMIDNGFTISEEYGWYDKSGIKNGRELIMICIQKGVCSVQQDCMR